MATSKMLFPLSVATPLSDELETDVFFPSCPVLLSRPDSLRGATLCMELYLIPIRAVLECGELVADLVPFDVIAFDVILGMDLLARLYASLDCR